MIQAEDSVHVTLEHMPTDIQMIKLFNKLRSLFTWSNRDQIIVTLDSAESRLHPL
jgi:hypothetical protein